MAYYTFVSRKGIVNPGLIESAIMFKLQLYKNLHMKKAVGFLREFTPHGRTGNLRKNATTWGMRIYSRYGYRFNLGWRNQDFRGINYAKFVDAGTRTPIVPKRAKYLVWQTNDGGWIRKESVRGQPPQYMFNQAVERFDEYYLYWLEKMRVATYRKMV